MGYELLATEGTYNALKNAGIKAARVNKVHEGRPHIVDLIKNRELRLVLNTPVGKQSRTDDRQIRSAAIMNGIPCITTRAGISAVVQALLALHGGEYLVRRVQSYHKRPTLPSAARV